MDKVIKPIDKIKGEIELPGDKSISHRVVFIGGIAEGRTVGKNFLEAEDCMHTVSAFRDMGIDVEIQGKKVVINGRGLKGLRKPEKELYLGNSGTTMRILPGILAGQDFEATLAGDESLSRRPMKRVIKPLGKMGVDVKSRDGLPPLKIKGGNVNAVEYSTPVASAQVKSCILFAGLYADGVTSVTEPFTSRDHTERMLKFFGAKISKENLKTSIEGKRALFANEIFVPGDISSAAFFIAAAALLEGSDLVIRNVGLNPTRIGFLDVLKRMGSSVNIKTRKDAVESYGDIEVKYAPLKGIVVEEKEIPLLIDEVPILSVLAGRAEGETVINGIAELRVKETDRVSSMVKNLIRMGATIKAEGGNIVIHGTKRRFKKAVCESFGDHRTAMAMSVASLAAEGDCEVKDTDCVNTSFPTFFDLVDYLKR